MTNQHPITPPPELQNQWSTKYIETPCSFADLIIEVARWGADEELQACINFVYDNELCDPDFYNNLRTARRPSPPSLKEQALEALEQIDGHAIRQMSAYVIYEELKTYADTIRQALEQLPND
jgi:hypothetical protein